MVQPHQNEGDFAREIAANWILYPFASDIASEIVFRLVWQVNWNFAFAFRLVWLDHKQLQARKGHCQQMGTFMYNFAFTVV